MNNPKARLKVQDVTPVEADCAPLPICPGIFKSNRDTYLIVGKVLSTEDSTALPEGRVAADEYVVEVPAGMIDLLKKGEL